MELDKYPTPLKVRITLLALPDKWYWNQKELIVYNIDEHALEYVLKDDYDKGGGFLWKRVLKVDCAVVLDKK